MTTSAATQLVFLVKGTRGDVQPAAVLAEAIQQHCPDLCISLATHATHQVNTIRVFNEVWPMSASAVIV